MPKVKDTLEQIGVTPSKGRGQNFLLSPDFINSIATFGEITPDDSVIEIGPGLGALTEVLYRKVGENLTLIEIEEKFCKELAKKFPKATIVQKDVRQFDFTAVKKGTVVFGNVPYSFSTDIIFTLLTAHKVLSRAVLLLQKEFAERVCAEPGGRDYGRLSVGVQILADTRLGPVIGGGYFHPPTKVDSQLLELVFAEKPKVEIGEHAWFEKVVKSAFHERRKMIPNSLYSSGLLLKDEAREVVEKAGISVTARSETLSLEDFSRLATVALEQIKKRQQ